MLCMGRVRQSIPGVVLENVDVPSKIGFMHFTAHG